MKMNVGVDTRRFPPGTKVAFYCRVSSKGQAKTGQGLDVQKNTCQQIADKYGWIVHKIYFNPNGVSGTVDPKERPEFMEMIRDGYARKFKIVLTFSLDRLGRTAGKTETAKELIYQHGLELCIDDQMLPNTITGRFYTSIHASMVAYDRDLLLERLQKGMDEAKRVRGETQGKVPYGYIKVGEGKKSRIEIDEYRAKIVETIYSMSYKEERSLNYIANKLNEMGIKAPRSAKWTHNKVAELLKGSRMRIYRGCERNGGNEKGIRWPVILGPEYDRYILDEPEEENVEEIIEEQNQETYNSKISSLQPLLPSINAVDENRMLPLLYHEKEEKEEKEEKKFSSLQPLNNTQNEERKVSFLEPLGRKEKISSIKPLSSLGNGEKKVSFLNPI